MIVVSDTSPISGLYRIGQLGLLKRLYGTVILPNTVMQELLGLSNFGYDLKEIIQADWFEVRKAFNLKGLEELQEELDAGEAEAIIIAQEIKADLLLIDESKGRRIAKANGLSIVGILGILLEAKSFGFIPAVKPLIDALLKDANFRIDARLLKEVLELAGE